MTLLTEAAATHPAAAADKEDSCASCCLGCCFATLYAARVALHARFLAMWLPTGCCCLLPLGWSHGIDKARRVLPLQVILACGAAAVCAVCQIGVVLACSALKIRKHGCVLFFTCGCLQAVVHACIAEVFEEGVLVDNRR
jgi:hypothetical protein